MANNLIPSSREAVLSPERTRAILRRFGRGQETLVNGDGTPRFVTWGDLAQYVGYVGA